MTLLEVLVVIAIMAIVLGLANFSFPGGGQRQARINGEKLTGQINHATLLATLRGTSMGLAFSDHQYQFMQRVQISEATTEWEPADQRGLNKVTELSSNGRLHLMLDSTPLALSAHIPDTPQLQFTPSGELPDFELLIAASGTDYTVSADPALFNAVLATNSAKQ